MQNNAKKATVRVGKGNGCPHYKKCGGCHLQNMTYEEQLKYKQIKEIKLLGKFCHVKEIIGMENPNHYRCKVQAAFKPMLPEEEFRKVLDILKLEISGSIVNIVARGTVNEVSEKLEQLNPLFCEAVLMMLEEIFIYEMEAVGYDYNNVLF